jgi:hypothetical protein
LWNDAEIDQSSFHDFTDFMSTPTTPAADDDNIAHLARAFFSAATKESPDDEDILPQVRILESRKIGSFPFVLFLAPNLIF